MENRGDGPRQGWIAGKIVETGRGLRAGVFSVGILAGLALTSCGGGSSGSTGGAAGVYSSGAQGGVTAMVSATVTASTTHTPTINATLYFQSNGTLTLVDLTNMLTCTGTGTTSGSTLSGTLNCIGTKVSYSNVSFTGTMSGSSISGSYTTSGGTPQYFSIGLSAVTSQPAVSIDNTTFTVPASGCPTGGSTTFGTWNGEMVMCPTGGSGNTGSNITIGPGGTIVSGVINFTLPSLPAQPLATNCTLGISGSQTITITGGTLAPLSGLVNVYSISNMTGTMAVTMAFTLNGTGCAAAGFTSSTFPSSFSFSGFTFTLTAGTASVVDMNGTNVLVFGGSVSLPAQTVGGVSQSAQTFSVPNTAI